MIDKSMTPYKDIKIDDLLNLTEKYAKRIHDLNLKRYIDQEEISDEIDSFLYWACEEIKRKTK